MQGASSWRRPAMAFIAMVFALSACGTTQEAAKKSSATTKGAVQAGRYKVGNPYQIAGAWYHPAEDLDYDRTGIASWYGPGFHGRPTANGERYDQNDLTAAHPTLPMPSMVQVTNMENGRSVKLRVNDRGPFAKRRIIDVSHKAAQLLGFEQQGKAKVRVKVLREESIQLAALARGDVLPPAPATAAPARDVQLAQAGAAPATTRPRTEEAGAAAARRPATGETASSRSRTPAPPAESGLFVQAGAFTDYRNASQLAAQLEPHGYVQIEPTAISGESFYRVRIGPVSSPDEANLLVARLASDGHTNSHVVSH